MCEKERKKEEVYVAKLANSPGAPAKNQGDLNSF